MGELFGPWIPREWVLKILEVIKENPHHAFQILTKYPSNATYNFPDNVWLGYTITDFYDLFWYDLKDFEDTKAKTHFISFEPLLGEIPTDCLNGNIDWIIIGSQTNPYKPPKKEWVLLLLGRAKQLGIPVFMKNNLKPLFSFPKFELCQEFPKEAG